MKILIDSFSLSRLFMLNNASPDSEIFSFPKEEKDDKARADKLVFHGLVKGGKLTESGIKLVAALTVFERKIKTVSSVGADFGTCWYLMNNGEFTIVSASFDDGNYAVCTPLTAAEANENARAFIKNVKFSILPSFSLTKSEYFLCLLIFVAEKKYVGKKKSVKFKNVFDDDVFSLISYAKNLCVSDEAWSAEKNMFKAVKKWREALDGLCGKGFAEIIVAGKNPQIKSTAAAQEALSDKYLLSLFVVSENGKTDFYRNTQSGLLKVTETQSEISFVPVNNTDVDIINE